MSNMHGEFRIINDEERFSAFRTLLKSSNLPADDLDFKRDVLIGYYEDDQLVGTGGLEVYGAYALLRSLSVRMGIRGRSIGSTMTERLVAEARNRKLKAVYLLTETAHDFFVKKGFADVTREQVPNEVRASSEFTHVCPVSAAVMELKLS